MSPDDETAGFSTDDEFVPGIGEFVPGVDEDYSPDDEDPAAGGDLADGDYADGDYLAEDRADEDARVGERPVVAVVGRPNVGNRRW